ncbi:MAG: hypothetical protein GWO40_15795 [Gammaproteobacteria bacterium]|nr:hypothetical protein [Gammaproteobacteria bacterium]NIR89855.1 hypothetical protein [Gammaproteobacteria bacterium]NIU05722.1 hypothetical protein [Gammaproteobacteria bacterium]NIV52482.1 hypothetical protein [Gammaproteobacteria bacterium]NIW86450.1 hypothetical protein [Gammaproteobacteria bacterium]
MKPARKSHIRGAARSFAGLAVLAVAVLLLAWPERVPAASEARWHEGSTAKPYVRSGASLHWRIHPQRTPRHCDVKSHAALGVTPAELRVPPPQGLCDAAMPAVGPRCDRRHEDARPPRVPDVRVALYLLTLRLRN